MTNLWPLLWPRLFILTALTDRCIVPKVPACLETTTGVLQTTNNVCRSVLSCYPSMRSSCQLVHRSHRMSTHSLAANCQRIMLRICCAVGDISACHPTNPLLSRQLWHLLFLVNSSLLSKHATLNLQSSSIGAVSHPLFWSSFFTSIIKAPANIPDLILSCINSLIASC